MNYLELLAVFLTIKALCGDCANLHIRVQCDNTTAVCYINNMGGSKSPDCNSVARQIWALPRCKNPQLMSLPLYNLWGLQLIIALLVLFPWTIRSLGFWFD